MVPAAPSRVAAVAAASSVPVAAAVAAVASSVPAAVVPAVASSVPAAVPVAVPAVAAVVPVAVPVAVNRGRGPARPAGPAAPAQEASSSRLRGPRSRQSHRSSRRPTRRSPRARSWSPRGITIQELAPKLNRTSADLVRILFDAGEMVTGTQSLADEMIELIAQELGAEVLLVEPGQEAELELQALLGDDDDEEDER